jgi:uncharacterized protein (DUF1800 family)
MHTPTRRELVERLLGVKDIRPPATLTPTPPRSDAAFAQQLAARATFGSNLDTAGEIQQLGAEQWLEQQLHPESINDDDCEQAVTNTISRITSGAADIRMLVRAMISKRQLAWRMTYFINNHFATYHKRTVQISEVIEDERFRQGCFGKFRDLLITSASSPAMIDFLDSQSNVAGNPNENYARELLELHTVSIDGGYTETDVAELARVFTGWRRVRIGQNPTTHSYFEFDATLHDTGPKSLSLGWSTPGLSGPDGRQEGYSALSFLAQNTRTAAFITKKLCRYFICDEPPVDLVSSVRSTFISTNGDLRETLRTLFLHPEFVQPQYTKNKTTDGFEYIVGVMRRFKNPGTNYHSIRDRIADLQSLPHNNHLPTGYAEVGSAWLGPGHTLPRWRFADDFAHDRIPGTTVPWSSAFQSPPSTGPAWVHALSNWMLDEPLPETTQWALGVYMDSLMAQLPGHPTWAQVRPAAQDLLALMLQLPEAQMH